jgi:hypothetical protein
MCAIAALSPACVESEPFVSTETDAGRTCENASHCDDGVACTDDRCQGGLCANPVAPGACLIDTACYASGDADPANPCLACRPTSSAAAFSARDDGATCGEAAGCLDQRCAAGACSSTVAAGSCLVDGVCYASGALHPTQACLACLPTTRVDAFSPLPDGAACQVGACVTGAACQGGACVGTVTGDPFEPNDQRGSATALGGADVVHEWPDGTVSTGTLPEPDDIDWYQFETFAFWAVPNQDIARRRPRVVLGSVPAGAELTVCAYATCLDSGNEVGGVVGCPAGASATKTGTTEGCCANSADGPVDLTLGTDCGGAIGEIGTRLARVYLTVEQSGGPVTCAEYAFEWGSVP